MKRYMRKKWMAFFMSLIMVMSMLSSVVHAEGLLTLEGKLKIKGESIVGTELQADYEELVTKDFMEEEVKFSWMRTSLEAEEKAELEQIENLTRVEVGKESTYILTEEDLGCIIILRITGIEEAGYTGFLEAKTDLIDEPAAEEAVVEEELVIDEEMIEEEYVEETVNPEEIIEEFEEIIPLEEALTEESVDEIIEEIPLDEISLEEEDLSEELMETVEEETSAEEAESDVVISEVTEENLGIDEVIVEEVTFETDGTAVEEVTYGLQTDLEENAVDFGVFMLGQENEITAKSVTLTNIGTGDIGIVLPDLDYFIISKVDSESPDILAPGSQIVYSIVPKNLEGLDAGCYVNEIQLGEEEKALVTILTAFEIREPEVPTEAPTEAPAEPTPEVTETPEEPTEAPTEAPAEPTPEVTETPEEPTEAPTEAPAEPTPEVTETPEEPTETPTEAPAEPTPEVTETPEEPAEPTPEVTPEPTPTPEPVIAISVSPGSHNFGAKENGYESAPDAQYITIVNTGDITLNLIQPASKYYEIGVLDRNVLAPNETVSFTVRPKAGLEKGEYYEVVYVETQEGVSNAVELNFVVASKTVKLQGIEQPADITGLKNGVKKTESGLKLPATVMISTTKGNMPASIVWDLDSCEYNRKSVKAQAFTVTGTVTLPEGIKNPNEINLKVTVNVTVKAYSPKIADAAQNVIAGITGNSYTTQSKITFTAVGAGMDNENPRMGDVRYCPASWGVFNTNTWKNASYTATFGMGQAGDYNLTVTYNRQQFDGESWVNTGEKDTKTISFEVVQTDDSVNLTPSPEEKETNQKNAVATGDTTMILPLVAALIAALVCVIIVLVYRKKR